MRNRLRELLQSGRPVYGIWSMLTDPTIVEMVGVAGFDYVGALLEHNTFDLQQTHNHLRAARARGLGHLIRLGSRDSSLLLRLLDMGTEGIMFSHVVDAADAARVVADCRYPPIGTRGMATMIPATDFDTTGLANRRETTEWFNRQVVVGLMIEDESAVEEIAKIVAIPTLDVIQIGATDLAASMGYMGEVSHPAVLAAIEKVRVACLDANVTLAMTVGHGSYPLSNEELLKQGYRMLICGIDMGILMAGLKQTAARVVRGRE